MITRINAVVPSVGLGAQTTVGRTRQRCLPQRQRAGAVPGAQGAVPGFSVPGPAGRSGPATAVLGFSEPELPNEGAGPPGRSEWSPLTGGERAQRYLLAAPGTRPRHAISSTAPGTSRGGTAPGTSRASRGTSRPAPRATSGTALPPAARHFRHWNVGVTDAVRSRPRGGPCVQTAAVHPTKTLLLALRAAGTTFAWTMRRHG